MQMGEITSMKVQPTAELLEENPEEARGEQQVDQEEEKKYEESLQGSRNITAEKPGCA